MSDKTKALDKIEERVCADLYKGQAPEVLTHFLFKALRDAVKEGQNVVAIPVSTVRQRVEEILDDAIADGTFRNAIRKVGQAMARCRPKVRAHLDVADEGNGLACDEATIDGVRHLVVVKGPQDREHPTMLQLEVEFRPLSERRPVVPVTAEVPETARLAIAHEDGLLPPEIQQDLHDMLRNMSTADWMFRENAHAHDFMRRHLSDLVTHLKSESQLCALGEIVTEYHDVALLTEWVAKLRDGDEFIGLTDWDCDWEWWGSVEGRRFFHANEIAAHQKAVVRRIFVYKTPEDPPSLLRLLEEIQRHRAAGIKVKTLSSSDGLSAAVLEELRSQCVLRARDGNGRLHGWMTYKVALRGGRMVNVFSINPQVIEGNERMLEAMWKSAASNLAVRNHRDVPRP